MDCDNFFPVFLLYSSHVLKGFGWAVGGNVDFPRVEHPDKTKLDVSTYTTFTVLTNGIFEPDIQATLDISNCQGTNKFVRDIESSTYRVFEISRFDCKLITSYMLLKLIICYISGCPTNPSKYC